MKFPKSNIYEQDYVLLDSQEDTVNILKTKHIDRKKEKRAAKLAAIAEKQSGISIKKSKLQSSNITSPQTTTDSSVDKLIAVFKDTISSVKVECDCNKCHNTVYGDLVSYIYSPSLELDVPFIRYSCKSCGHLGHRTVVSKGLPPPQFEKYYF